jgi:hypothetical protein
MQTFIYRWKELKSNPAECDGPLYEIRGDADALFQVAKRLELPPRPFKSEFLTLAGTPADIHGASADVRSARRAAAAEKAATAREAADKGRERLWIRIGDAGDYNEVGDIYAAVDDLNAMEVGEVGCWIDGGPGIGFDTPNYHGHDFVSCFWGDAEANLIRALNADEKAYIENNLEAVLN